MLAAVADGEFEFGHSLCGYATCEVLHGVLAFPGFQTFNVYDLCKGLLELYQV
jgi:hypothetical protein